MIKVLTTWDKTGKVLMWRRSIFARNDVKLVTSEDETEGLD